MGGRRRSNAAYAGCPHPAERLEAAVARALLPSADPLLTATILSPLPHPWRETPAEQLRAILREEPALELVRDAGGCWARRHVIAVARRLRLLGRDGTRVGPFPSYTVGTEAEEETVRRLRLRGHRAGGEDASYCESEMSSPRKHHIVPQLYQKGFARQQGKGWYAVVLSRETGEARPPSNVRDIFAERDYNTVVDADGNRDFGAERRWPFSWPPS